jgi:iron complex transport system ATP-binding protein
MTVRSSAKQLAVMAQHSVYNFDFKVREVVFMGRSPHKKMLERDNARDYEIVRNALDKVHMLEAADREFSTLSGGEQQRVILARALAQQTECLILDEPTNHLDITYQLSLLKILKQQNMTICAAMHDLNLAAMFCDEIYIMKDGKIQAYGTPKEVLTAEMIAKVYEVDAEVAEDKNGVLHVLYHIS